MVSQQKLWNKIAPEWYDFKAKPAEHTWNFLKDKKGKILDLGSGAGRNLINLKTKAEFYLCDFSQEMIKLAKKRAKKEKIKANFFVADITKLPFEDNFFDFAISSSIFHCIKKNKHKKAVKEFFRVLKPGAEAEVSVWNKGAKRFKNAPKEKYIGWRTLGKRYYYLFDEKEIHSLFKEQGFKIKERFEPHGKIIFVVKKPRK